MANKCLECGKEISNPKFCNNSCSAKYNNSKRKIKKTVDRKAEGRLYWKVPKYCQYCGKKLFIGQSKYCSTQCSANDLKKNSIEKFLSGSYTGKLFIPFGVKEYLRNLSDNKCSLCGWGETNITTGRVPLQIHHIDGNARNQVISNVKVLCPNCHSLTGTYGGLNVGNSTNGGRTHYEKYRKKYYRKAK